MLFETRSAAVLLFYKPLRVFCFSSLYLFHDSFAFLFFSNLICVFSFLSFPLFRLCVFIHLLVTGLLLLFRCYLSNNNIIITYKTLLYRLCVHVYAHTRTHVHKRLDKIRHKKRSAKNSTPLLLSDMF